MSTTLRKKNEQETAEQGKHTSLPWLLDTSHKYDREGVTIWSGDQIVADIVPDQHGQHEANAALIVHRVNSFDALVAALKAVDETYAYHKQGSVGSLYDGPLPGDIKQQVRAALAAVKGVSQL